jgi:hypothetical protein
MVLVASPAHAQTETSRAVDGGGISVEGWMGKIDANEVEAGLSLENSMFAKMGDAIHVKTGPSAVYWGSANHGHGNYTVSATFTEPAYMEANSHPHPYGIVIGGNDMGTDSQSYLYCAAYGNGTFIVRGFGPEPFQMNGRRSEANAAVNTAEPGKTVSQDIAVSVTDDSVSCSINGTVVATYPKSELVTAGKLKSTDGMYGVRYGHNTEAMISNLKITQH